MKKDNKNPSNKIDLTLYNVVILPSSRQSPDRYVELFQKILERHISYATYGDKYTQIFSLHKGDDILYGELINYTQLDSNKDWYNSTKGEIESFKFDVNMHPNVKKWIYFFRPSTHTLAVTSNASVSQIDKYFTYALSEVADDSAEEEIRFNVISSKETIEKILNASDLTSLEVKVHYSNNDSGDDWQEKIDDSMKDSDIRSANLKVTGTKKSPIKILKESFIAGFIKLGRKNGEITAISNEGGKRKVISTKNLPEKVSVKYDNEAGLLSKLMQILHS